MNRSRLLLGVASVLGGTAVVLVVAGVAYNPLLVIFALPFAAAAYFLWADATGRMRARWARSARRGGRTRRSASQGPRRGRSRRARRTRSASPRDDRGSRGADATAMDRTEALGVLGLEGEADEAAIRRAYRERVKEVHPDAEGGDEEAFKRVTDAYDHLLD